MANLKNNLLGTGLDLAKAGRDGLVMGGLVYLFMEARVEVPDYALVTQNISYAKDSGMLLGGVDLVARFLARMYNKEMGRQRLKYPEFNNP